MTFEILPSREEGHISEVRKKYLEIFSLLGSILKHRREICLLAQRAVHTAHVVLHSEHCRQAAKMTHNVQRERKVKVWRRSVGQAMQTPPPVTLLRHFRFCQSIAITHRG